MQSQVVVLSPQVLRDMLEEAAEIGARKVLAGERPEVGQREVAAMLGVTERTVRRMELRGELPRRLGRLWDRSEIERFRREKRAAAP